MFAIETGDRLCYGAVNTDHTGRVSVGCGQWYGTQAVQLLRLIHAEDETLFDRKEAEFLLSSGTLPCLQEEHLALVRTVLTSEAGIRVQNAWMDKCLEDGTNRAKALGITDADSLLLCAALYQLRGAAAAERLITQAGQSPDKEALLRMIKDLEPGLYRTCCLLVE